MDRLKNIFSRPKDQEISHSLLQQDVVTMLKHWDMRPEPTTLVLLIQNGLSNENIAQAARSQGYSVPDMEDTLAELSNILPTLSLEVDAVADIVHSDSSNNTTPVFLGRDAELLYDAYSVSYRDTFPQQEPVLLPGSQGIWNHRIDVFSGLQDEREFLESYGITEKAIQSKKTFLLIDGGFAGHIAVRIRECVSRIYGITQEQATTLFPIKLVAKRKSATHPDSLPVTNSSQLIADLDPLSEEEYSQIFKRAYFTSNKYTVADVGFFGHVAIALQIMPHFHGPYEAIKSHNGKRIGIPTPQPIETDLNKVMRVNDEVINPTAALIVQREVVKFMLEKRKSIRR